MPVQEFLVALGGNLPSDQGMPEHTLTAALSDCAEERLHVVRVSKFYDTPCFPAGAGPDYVNAAAVLQSDLPPVAVLKALHRIEARHGRSRNKRWGMRTLDMDLLAAGDLVLPDAASQARWRDLPPEQQIRCSPSKLILPHPRLQDRAFVLVPLCDVAPDWVHPVTGKSVAQMCAALPASDTEAVKPRE